jgi:hypothetical protein
MILSYTIVITCFLGMILYYVKKQLPFMVNAILYMLLVIFFTNYTTIFSLNLHLFKHSLDSVHFICFLLYREFIMSFITVIFLNLFINSTWVVKGITFMITLVSMELMDFYMIKTKTITYLQWSLIYELLFNLLFLLLGIVIAKILLFINKKEEYKL